MLGWIYLALAIVFEVSAATSLKLANGIPGIDQGARIIPFSLMLVFYVVCFIFMSKSLQTIQLGVMYACWAGLGTILVAIVGVLDVLVLAFRRDIAVISAVVIWLEWLWFLRREGHWHHNGTGAVL